jgi:hypothetical protein
MRKTERKVVDVVCAVVADHGRGKGFRPLTAGGGGTAMPPGTKGPITGRLAHRSSEPAPALKPPPHRRPHGDDISSGRPTTRERHTILLALWGFAQTFD